MNKNYSCDIIKDLLPGYIDGILSETGTNVVKEHLEECEKCNNIYLEMEEALDTGIVHKEQIALDGFRKVRQHTRKLKITVGIVTGLLILLLASIFLKTFVIGEPLPTHQVSEVRLSYDEETECLVINGTIDLSSYRVSRVVWKQSEEDADAVNVFVYGAEKLPFQQDKKDFTITIPNMKGRNAFFACPDYDQLKVYDWKLRRIYRGLLHYQPKLKTHGHYYLTSVGAIFSSVICVYMDLQKAEAVRYRTASAFPKICCILFWISLSNASSLQCIDSQTVQRPCGAYI